MLKTIHQKLSLFKSKSSLKSPHHVFVFTIPLMLAIGIIILAALITISRVIVAVGGPLMPQLITEMPTSFDYDPDTGDMILDDDTYLELKDCNMPMTLAERIPNANCPNCGKIMIEIFS